MVGWDLLAAILRQSKEEQDEILADALRGLAIQRKLLQGDVASAIVQTAHEERPDLIMMPSHSFTFTRFLLSSATAEVLHGAECPVWTGAHVQISPVQNFAIRDVLCAVKFGPRADIAVSWAAQMAAQFAARLTLANITAGVEMWGGWRQLRRSKVERGVRQQRFPANGQAPARHRHQGGCIHRQWGRAPGPEPGCQADKGGFAGFRMLPLWRSPANPRIRHYFRGARPGIERVIGTRT